MKIRFHMPAYMDFDPPSPAEFADESEFLAVPKVADWHSSLGFTHFSYSNYANHRDGPDCKLLSAHFSDGKHWVVGYVTGGDLAFIKHHEFS